MPSLESRIAETLYASDAQRRTVDKPLSEQSLVMQRLYQRNAVAIIESYILPILHSINANVEAMEDCTDITDGTFTIVRHNLDAILEDYDYGELLAELEADDAPERRR